MGSFQIWDIRFKAKEDKEAFEKIFNKEYLDKIKILVGQDSNSRGFIAWTMTRNIELDIVYDAGYCGYAELNFFLKRCKAENINIKFASYLSINDRMTGWTKVKGRHYA